MIHPEEGYVLKANASNDSCRLEKKDVACSLVEGETKVLRVVQSKFCGCLWVINNLEYLQWKYEKNR